MDEYINRDALLQEIEQERRASKNSFPRQHFVVGDVLTCIRTAPAADVVEVRHGRWIDLNTENSTGPLFKCSECSHLHNPNRNDLDLERVELKPLYCDACGARMDKEDEHE